MQKFIIGKVTKHILLQVVRDQDAGGAQHKKDEAFVKVKGDFIENPPKAMWRPYQKLTM